MTTIRTPATIAEADKRLTNIERVVMAKGWERAAILATIVRLTGSGRKAELRFSSPNEYAERGIPGLTNHETVRTYVQRWLDAHDGKYPDADLDIELPTAKWPPVDKHDSGSRTTTKNIGKTIAEDPAMAEAAALALAAGALELVTDETARDLTQAGIQQLAEGPTPAGTSTGGKKKTKKPTTELDEQPDEAYWATTRAALAHLLDLKVRISHGITVPGDVAISLQILAPETDWDAAAAELAEDLR